MKLRIGLLILGMAGIMAAGFAAGGDGLEKHTVWVVPYDHSGKIEVMAGDVIELWTLPLPLIAENLDKTFRASREGGGVELVGYTLPHREGSMERLYFFKAFDAGPATLKVELLDGEGSVQGTWAYEVEVKKAVVSGSNQ